jgi:hypothetical protein
MSPGARGGTAGAHHQRYHRRARDYRHASALAHCNLIKLTSAAGLLPSGRIGLTAGALTSNRGSPRAKDLGGGLQDLASSAR